MILDAAPETLMLLTMVIPTIAAILIPFFHASPNLRETVTLVAAVALLIVVLHLMPVVTSGGRPEALSFEMIGGLSFALKLEPLGMLFALVASTLWIVNSVYSIGYMRGHDEPRQTSFYVCFAVAIASTMGLALSANLLTLFIFYEILTLSTYPLVTHKGDEEARNGGRVYLILLLGTSMLLLLPAIFVTYAIAGTTDFTPGGILAGNAAPGTIGLLIGLFAFGIGKAGLMPFHFWLPSAMVAPTPVSALLHAVAVVKAGVFTVLKVVVYIFGIDFLRETGAAEWLVYVASFSIIVASLVALMQDNLKARLAYSTVSQLAYIVVAAMLATPASIIGGGLHIAMHAAGKITLFFCAGAFYVAAHKTQVSQLGGIGHKMPLTMTAFGIGALSIIGLPPLGGTWSKWWLMVGALDAGHQFVIGVLMLSSLLNVWYLLSIVLNGFFPPAIKPVSLSAAAPDDVLPDDLERRYPLIVIAPCVTALACVALFFFADDIVALIQPITTK
jgi:multicomponent Na+:H+ antiporter subunit D